MATKNALNQRIAKSAGMPQAEATRLSGELFELIANILSQDESIIAIPGFGEFATVKTDERIITDDAGRHMLIPPEITVSFTPGSALKKNTGK